MQGAGALLSEQPTDHHHISTPIVHTATESKWAHSLQHAMECCNVLTQLGVKDCNDHCNQLK